MKNLPARKTWACGVDILWSGFVGYFCLEHFFDVGLIRSTPDVVD